MSITVEIDEAILREAEGATNIHDPAGLELLARKGVASAEGAAKPFDFDEALAAAADLPDLTDEEFDRFEKR